MKDIRTILSEGNTLVFDGAMGTYFASLPGQAETRCEAANLINQEAIAAIHRAYLDAGCRAIKTNTFTAGVDLAEGQTDTAHQIIKAACRIAQDCIKPYDAYVFADIGPAPESGALSRAENYCRQADLFLSEGVEYFLLETLPSDAGISEFAKYLKARCPSSFLIISYAVAMDGTTREGDSGRTLFQRTATLPEVDVVGFNCVSGPRHLLDYIQKLDRQDIRLTVMPNAGYPTVLGRRTIYQGTPAYFGEKLAEIVQAGAQIIGGCCGTTPAHIAEAAKALSKPLRIPTPPPSEVSAPPATPQANPLSEKLDAGRQVIAVELDPPADDDISFFLEGVQALQTAGADAVTIADCPIGRPRADSSLLACKIKRELDMEPLPHMTCRDRNFNATKALLLGLSMEGVHNVLLVTGDPIPSENRDEVKSVFNFNSRKLARYVTSLNQTVLRTPFRLFGALNLNAKNFAVQLKIAQEKEANGITGFLTQPVLSREALENLKSAHETLQGKILCGIYPVVSHKNACFLNNEIAGMRISDEITALYEGKNCEEAEDLAVKISAAIVKEATPYADGLYLMTPFKRVTLMTRILNEIR